MKKIMIIILSIILSGSFACHQETKQEREVRIQIECYQNFNKKLAEMGIPSDSATKYKLDSLYKLQTLLKSKD